MNSIVSVAYQILHWIRPVGTSNIKYIPKILLLIIFFFFQGSWSKLTIDTFCFQRYQRCKVSFVYKLFCETVCWLWKRFPSFNVFHTQRTKSIKRKKAKKNKKRKANRKTSLAEICISRFFPSFVNLVNKKNFFRSCFHKNFYIYWIIEITLTCFLAFQS